MNISIFNAQKEFETTVASQTLILITFAFKCKETDGLDYTRWTEADVRILRRKRLAKEFDQRIADYFRRGHKEVMRNIYSSTF